MEGLGGASCKAGLSPLLSDHYFLIGGGRSWISSWWSRSPGGSDPSGSAPFKSVFSPFPALAPLPRRGSLPEQEGPVWALHSWRHRLWWAGCCHRSELSPCAAHVSASSGCLCHAERHHPGVTEWPLCHTAKLSSHLWQPLFQCRAARWIGLPVVFTWLRLGHVPV